jgi:DNA-binding transcriptional LysR family regulator
VQSAYLAGSAAGVPASEGGCGSHRGLRPRADAIMVARQEAGFKPRITQEAPQMASTISLVATGIGVTLVPKSMCQLPSQGVRYLAIDGVAPHASLSLTSCETPISSTADYFFRLVLKAAARLDRKRAVLIREDGKACT